MAWSEHEQAVAPLPHLGVLASAWTNFKRRMLSNPGALR